MSQPLRPRRPKNLLLRAVGLGAGAAMIGSTACSDSSGMGTLIGITDSGPPPTHDGALGRQAEDTGVNGLIAEAGGSRDVAVGTVVQDSGHLMGKVAVDGGHEMGLAPHDSGFLGTAVDAGLGKDSGHAVGTSPHDGGFLGDSVDAGGAVGIGPVDGG